MRRIHFACLLGLFCSFSSYAETPKPNAEQPAAIESSTKSATQPSPQAGVETEVPEAQPEGEQKTDDNSVVTSRGMTVYGDDKGPNAMITVPWIKQLPDTSVDGFAFSSSDRLFKPLDRKEFLRQVEYYQLVFSESSSDK